MEVLSAYALRSFLQVLLDSSQERHHTMPLLMHGLPVDEPFP